MANFIEFKYISFDKSLGESFLQFAFIPAEIWDP